jgi:hypothetical protein
MSFYKYITELRNDSEELKTVMEAVSNDLNDKITDDIKPGILLGLIQSGKTRAFVGVIAKCFDLGYDVTIVFTKNSVALVEQTMKRLKSEFKMPIEKNKLYVWDVIKIQNTDQLSGYILQNKIIIVVKKESKNLDLFLQTELINKKILIIDDEADQASVSFKIDKDSEEGIDFATVASKISTLRNQLKGKNSYLQVTATPYSLYLQPEDQSLNQIEYAPLRPAFTYLLKPHSGYIGGEYYFEDSQDNDSAASYLHVLVTDNELDFLNTKSKSRNDYDQRVLNNLLDTTNLIILRTAIFNFLIGGAIRQLQEQNDDIWSKKYHAAFLLHTSTSKKNHAMQKSLLEKLLNSITTLTKDELTSILKSYYLKIDSSINKLDLEKTDYVTIINVIYNALKEKHIGIVEVNSENQVADLLGEDGQLRLDNPFNIFVGGQSLDRGITIDHLIGFFYGRAPLTFQMDTVLQHSRMYGNRSKEDLAVTRFYASARVYEAMRSMHWFDRDLRDNIENDIENTVTRFIAKKGNEIIPASPNKLRASNLISFKANSRLLPIGFQTLSYTNIKNDILFIDNIIETNNPDGKEHFEITKDDVEKIIIKIRNTFTYEPQFGNVGLEWDITPFINAIKISLEKNNTDKVIIYNKTNRNASRFKQGGSFGDAPDDGKTDLPICKKLAKVNPVLMLLKQNGLKSSEWRDAPFYWPVLVLPKNIPNYVYCED